MSDCRWIGTYVRNHTDEDRMALYIMGYTALGFQPYPGNRLHRIMTRLAKSTNYEWVVTVGERLAAGAIISSKRRQNKFQVGPVKFEDALQGPDGINPRKAGILTMSYTSAEIYEVLCPPDGIGERDARMAEFFLSWQQRSSACGSMVRKLQVLRELGLLGTEFVNGILYGANIFGLAVIITNGDNLMRALEDQINIMNKKVGYTDNGPIGL